MNSFKKATTFTALFAFILCLGFSSSFAQDTTKVPPPPQPSTYMLKGKVVDAQTAEVLADAEITIVGQDITTVTDEEGKFMLENLPTGEHTLKVTYQGYQEWEKNVTLDKNAELTIKLKPKK